MILTPQSSHVEGVEYDEGLNLLRVAFKDGSMYEYQRVTPEEWDSLRFEINDPGGSVGRWLHVHIKAQKATHPYTKIK